MSGLHDKPPLSSTLQRVTAINPAWMSLWRNLTFLAPFVETARTGDASIPLTKPIAAWGYKNALWGKPDGATTYGFNQLGVALSPQISPTKVGLGRFGFTGTPFALAPEGALARWDTTTAALAGHRAGAFTVFGVLTREQHPLLFDQKGFVWDGANAGISLQVNPVTGSITITEGGSAFIFTPPGNPECYAFAWSCVHTTFGNNNAPPSNRFWVNGELVVDAGATNVSSPNVPMTLFNQNNSPKATAAFTGGLSLFGIFVEQPDNFIGAPPSVGPGDPALWAAWTRDPWAFLRRPRPVEFAPEPVDPFAVPGPVLQLALQTVDVLILSNAPVGLAVPKLVSLGLEPSVARLAVSTALLLRIRRES